MRFVLVHGGSHGRWCWTFLESEMMRLGHQTVSMDLPGHGARSSEIASLAGYRDAVVEHLRSGDVLVGHSMGTFVATLAADAMPELRHIVFLAGPLAIENESLFDATTISGSTEESDPDKQHVAQFFSTSGDGEYLEFDRSAAVAAFYHDCESETAQWAASRLDPQLLDVLVTPVSVPAFWAADLPRSFIECADDQAFPSEVADWTATRLGVDPLTIDSSHSPFLSRPRELAQLLEVAVTTVPTAPARPGRH